MTEPNFKNINKHVVQINSIRLKLKKVKTLEELLDLSLEITELEILISVEKKAGYEVLEQEKKKVQTNISQLQKKLTDEELRLREIENKIKRKLQSYKQTSIYGLAKSCKLESIVNHEKIE